MSFSSLINQFWPSTVNGLVLGSVYALIALGYTLVYGVLRLINFANSEVFMLSAFGSFLAIDLLGIPDRLPGGGNPYKSGIELVGVLVVMFLVSVLVGGASAVALERIAYRPLRKRNAPRLVFLISAIGASFAMAEAVGDEAGHPVAAGRRGSDDVDERPARDAGTAAIGGLGHLAPHAGVGARSIGGAPDAVLSYAAVRVRRGSDPTTHRSRGHRWPVPVPCAARIRWPASTPSRRG